MENPKENLGDKKERSQSFGYKHENISMLLKLAWTKLKSTKRPEETACNRERVNTHDIERAHQINRRLVKDLIENIGKEIIIQEK